MVTQHPSLVVDLSNISGHTCACYPTLTTLTCAQDNYSDKRLMINTFQTTASIQCYSIPGWTGRGGCSIDTCSSILLESTTQFRWCWNNSIFAPMYIWPRFCTYWKTCSISIYNPYVGYTNTTTITDLSIKIIDTLCSSCPSCECPIGLRCPINFYHRKLDGDYYCCTYLGQLAPGCTSFSTSGISFTNCCVNQDYCSDIVAVPHIPEYTGYCDQTIVNVISHVTCCSGQTCCCCKSGTCRQELYSKTWY